MAEAPARDARLGKAEALLGAGNPAAAIALLSAVLATAGARATDCRAALLLRSRARVGLSDLPAAIDDLQRALDIEPRDARARNTLGILLADHGNTADAIAELTLAVQIDPAYVRAWNNLGSALRSAGRVDEAAAAVRRAVAADPGYALAWSHLGAILAELGDEIGARDAYERALALKSDARVVLALAGLARRRGDLDGAVDLYSRAVTLLPADANAWLQLAGTLAERDDLAAARGAYANARARQPTLLRAAFGEALTLPMVYAGGADVLAARAGYDVGIARLASEVPPLVRGRVFDDVIDDLRWTNFLLAYQGEDDRDLQARFATIAGSAVAAVAPEWRAPPRSSAGLRIRVGFASAFFNDGTCGRYFRSWITRLDRTRFEIFVYHLRRDRTSFLAGVSPHADRVRTFFGATLAPSAVARAIRADALDALVYPELGMDATSFALAALRLAPVQCTAWGHPVTTGHATLDAFFSCAAMEPADADAHYAERLVRLPGIGTDYAQPTVPADATRTALGLPENVPLLLCPQSLFKIHPDNDALFARVLAAAPTARLVVFEGRHPALTAKYRVRLGAALACQGVRIDERLIMLPQCGHDDYLRINVVCDAMLDTLRWSGGNTSLDALAAGLPIVTLPGRFMRARQSAAMLSLAGLDELVARGEDDYVRIAAQLATDGAWRAAIACRIRDDGRRLFGDAAPVQVFAAALESLVRRS